MRLEELKVAVIQIAGPIGEVARKFPRCDIVRRVGELTKAGYLDCLRYHLT